MEARRSAPGGCNLGGRTGAQRAWAPGYPRTCCPIVVFTALAGPSAPREDETSGEPRRGDSSPRLERARAAPARPAAQRPDQWKHLNLKSRHTHPPPPTCTAATDTRARRPLWYLQCRHTHTRENYTESQHSEGPRGCGPLRSWGAAGAGGRGLNRSGKAGGSALAAQRGPDSEAGPWAPPWSEAPTAGHPSSPSEVRPGAAFNTSCFPRGAQGTGPRYWRAAALAGPPQPPGSRKGGGGGPGADEESAAGRVGRGQGGH